MGENGRFEYVNPAYAKMVGRSTEELIGKSPFDFTHPDDLQHIRQAKQQRLSGEHSTYEIRLVRPDGTLVHAHITGVPRKEGNRIVGSYAIVTDLTSHKQTEKALQESKDQLAGIIASAMDAIISIDEDQRIVLFNAAAEMIYGWSAADIIGQHHDILIPERFRAVHRQHVQHFGQTNETNRSMNHLGTLWGLRANGQEFPIDVSISQVKVGSQKLYTAILRDITEQLQVEQALHESTEKYRSLLDNMLEGCQIVGFDWRYLYVNDAVAKQGRQAKEGLLGHTMMEIYPGIEQTEMFIVLRRCMDERTTAHMENEFIYPDDSKGWFELRVQPVPEGIFILSFDITERKRAEQAIHLMLDTQKQIAQINNLEEIYQLVGKQIRELIGDGYTVTSMFDETIQAMRLAGLYGFGNRYQALVRKFNIDPTRMVYSLADMTKEELRVFKSGKLEKFDGGLYALLTRKVPKRICKAVEKRLKISVIYTMGFVWHGLHYGGLTILARRDITLYKDMIETIMNQASIAIKRAKSEEALRESEERLRLFIDHSPAALAMFDREMRYLAASRRWLTDYGFGDQDIIGQSHYEIFPEISDRWKLFYRRALAGEVVRNDEDNFARPDGTVQWLRWEMRPWYAADDTIGGIVLFTEDITERKQAVDALRQSETQLQHIIDTVPEGVLLLAADGAVYLTNPVADRYLSILTPEWENGRLTHLGRRPLNDLLTSPPKGMWHDIADEQHVFAAIAQPIEVSPNNTGWVLLVRDVTQERDIQQRVQRQERLAAVGQLAAGIAHDFNNIIAVITLYTQLISRTVEMSAGTQEKMQTIEKQALRATELIQQILDFSRQSVLERRPLDLLPFIKELVKLLNRTLPENIRVELAAGKDTYLIYADPSRMQQMMMNLAVNARDAMPQGGQLRIGLAHTHIKKRQTPPIRDMQPGDWIQIEVADTGSGIPPETLPQIFEPFFTTKEVGQGTGLGLAQVYGIVQQHKGYIDVKTKVRQGTTFTLYFPTLQLGKETTVMPDKTLLKHGHGQMILVVEDDPATRQALIDSLALMNYRVIHAVNGREALSVLDTKAGDIALVLSDIVMPEMGGVALFHTMRQKNIAIPLVLLTGHPLSKELGNLRALGLADWLSKPPDIVKLSHSLARILND
ncbi:MAG: PAS domain S-box protein [Anaerolineales bacterium]|nr:PAS domain S-box protein [Anaerolineales bacterium]